MTTKAYLFKCDINELVSIFVVAQPMPMWQWASILTNVLFGRTDIFRMQTHSSHARTPVHTHGHSYICQCDNGILNLAGWSRSLHFELILLTLHTKQFAVDTNKIGNLSSFSIFKAGRRFFLYKIYKLEKRIRRNFYQHLPLFSSATHYNVMSATLNFKYIN